MKLKIGILGTRGIPNAYGGFEEFAEQLSVLLVKRGHEVYVYNSHLHPYQNKNWNGVNIIHCKDWESKIGTAGQFIYDLNCINDARKRNFTVLLQLGYTSNSLWRRRWPHSSINIVNMDGLEWKRAKYSSLTRKFLKKAEKWAALHADHLIADSPAIRDHLMETYKRPSTFIPYAATIFDEPQLSSLEKFRVSPGEYCLAIARMEPENNIEMIIEGYSAAKQTCPLVVIGNTDTAFGKKWQRKYESEKIKFAGAIYDKNLLNNLRYFSKIYFHGHSVGGTNPSLLEAMACQCNIAAHNNPFNRAILKNDAFYFSDNSGVENIFKEHPAETAITERKKNNLEKIRTIYNWEKITGDYEKLFLDMAGKNTSK